MPATAAADTPWMAQGTKTPAFMPGVKNLSTILGEQDFQWIMEE